VGRVSPLAAPLDYLRTHEIYLQRCEIRYMLPIISPASPDVPTLKPNPTGDALPSSPSSSKFSEPPIFFDAREVARRDDGWEDMLERILFRWTLAVVEERRSHSR
jgi:hypothetical protein